MPRNEWNKRWMEMEKIRQKQNEYAEPHRYGSIEVTLHQNALKLVEISTYNVVFSSSEDKEGNIHIYASPYSSHNAHPVSRAEIVTVRPKQEIQRRR